MNYSLAYIKIKSDKARQEICAGWFPSGMQLPTLEKNVVNQKVAYLWELVSINLILYHALGFLLNENSKLVSKTCKSILALCVSTCQIHLKSPNNFSLVQIPCLYRWEESHRSVMAGTIHEHAFHMCTAVPHTALSALELLVLTTGNKSRQLSSWLKLQCK